MVENDPGVYFTHIDFSIRVKISIVYLSALLLLISLGTMELFLFTVLFYTTSIVGRCDL